MAHLKSHNVSTSGLKCAAEVFQHLAEVGNGKEMILCFLENIDPMIDYDLVQMLFSPLRTGT